MIRYYEGVEGAGKTCLMTKDLYRHKSYGGRVLAFPGYELYGRTKKQVLSELILPEQIYSLINVNDTSVIRDQHIVIAIDEITNFISHHNWWNNICDIVNTVLQERRKLGVAVLATGPEYKFLPSDIRYMFHEIVHCTNAHSFNREIPSELACIFYKEDRRGMLSPPWHRFTNKKKFLMSKWHKHYNTYSAVGYNQNIKMSFEKREITVDLEGNLIEKAQSNAGEMVPIVMELIKDAKNPPEEISKGELFSYIREKTGRFLNKREMTSISMIMTQLGYSLNRSNRYSLAET